MLFLLLEVLRLLAPLLAVLFRPRAVERLAVLFLAGTFLPFLRASESPIAIACWRLFTFPPLPPLPFLSVPDLRLLTALFTSLLADFEYLRAMIPP